MYVCIHMYIYVPQKSIYQMPTILILKTKCLQGDWQSMVYCNFFSFQTTSQDDKNVFLFSYLSILVYTYFLGIFYIFIIYISIYFIYKYTCIYKFIHMITLLFPSIHSLSTYWMEFSMRVMVRKAARFAV